MRALLSLVAAIAALWATSAAAGPCEDLAKAYAATPAGGTLALGRETLGCDLTVRKPLKLAAAEAGGGLRSLKVVGVTGVVIEGIAIRFTPNDATRSFNPAVLVDSARDVVIRGLDAEGGLATYTSADRDSIKGSPTGTALAIRRSSNVAVLDCRLSTFDKGIVPGTVTGLSIVGCEISNTRTGMISGSALSPPTLIAQNYLHGSNPVDYGGSGDHATFIHFWPDPKALAAPMDGIRIVGNHLDQGAGVPIMGISLDDNAKGLGYVNALIAGNTIVSGTGQGMRLENVRDSVVEDNVLLQASAGRTLNGEPDWRDAPSINMTAGSAVTLRRNQSVDVFGAFAAQPGNITLPRGVRPAVELAAARAAAQVRAGRLKPPAATWPDQRARVSELEVELAAMAEAARAQAAKIEAARAALQ